MTSNEMFGDVLAANEKYVARFDAAGLAGRAAKGLAVVTCMDTRVDPLAVLGLRIGDAKIVRNAGARVTDDVLSDLVLARYLLGVDRIIVMVHTRCAMSGATPDDVHAKVAAAGGPDTSGLTFRPAEDQAATLRADVERVRSSSYLSGVTVGGFVYDVDTGAVNQLV